MRNEVVSFPFHDCIKATTLKKSCLYTSAVILNIHLKT